MLNFRVSSNDSSGASILVVVQWAQVYSDSLKQKVLALNDTLSNDKMLAITLENQAFIR